MRTRRIVAGAARPGDSAWERWSRIFARVGRGGGAGAGGVAFGGIACASGSWVGGRRLRKTPAGELSVATSGRVIIPGKRH